MKKMINYHFAVYQYIIKEDDDMLAQVGLKQLVHRCLERGWCIAQSKRHHSKLIMLVMSSKRCFTNVLLVHQDLMIPLHQIQFREPASASEFIQ